MSTSNDEFSTTVTCTLDNDSFSDSAVEWLGHSRLLLDYMNGSAAMKNYTVSLLGGSSIEADAKIAVEDGLGMMIAATMICVFVVTALFLRSVMAPLRSVISILLTLITVYGMDVIVCQGSAGSLSWLTVPMSFSIIVGLGLDYDMFLINRVIEYRIAGYDHHSSIVGGLAQTGKTITAAGVIMAASFGGLLFSSSPIASQWSFSLTAAVLIDTFVMRSCVVPILMAKTGQYSWYPRELPESSLTLFPGQNDDHVLL
jgi:RND superfamily putative drug exporter